MKKSNLLLVCAVFLLFIYCWSSLLSAPVYFIGRAQGALRGAVYELEELKNYEYRCKGDSLPQ